MKKIILMVVMFLIAISFTGCSKIKDGTYELYYNDKLIGEIHSSKILEKGDMYCMVNFIYSYEDIFEYACWDKEKVDLIKVEED